MRDSALCAVVGAALLAGCGAAPEVDPSELAREERVASAEQAIGEATCRTTAPNRTPAWAPGTPGGFLEGFNPGYDNANCRKAVIVRSTLPSDGRTHFLRIGALDLAAPPATQSACASTITRVIAYNENSGATIVNQSGAGTWIDGKCKQRAIGGVGVPVPPGVRLRVTAQVLDSAGNTRAVNVGASESGPIIH